MGMKTPYSTKMVRVSTTVLDKLQEVKKLMLQVHKKNHHLGGIAFLESISLSSLIYLAALEAESTFRSALADKS